MPMILHNKERNRKLNYTYYCLAEYVMYNFFKFETEQSNLF